VRELFIGRQPIVGRDRRICGYELLFRDRDGPLANIKDSREATARVIMEFLMDMGVENLVGSKLAFLNADEAILREEFLELLPPHKTVFEILETCTDVETLRHSIGRLKGAGFLFALDDFERHSALSALLKEIDFVKLDVKAKRRGEIERDISFLKGYSARLIAEKVENEKEFRYLFDAGFDMFQGFFFAQPLLIRKRSVSPERATLMQVLAAIEADKESSIIEGHFRKHQGLTYKLLRYINSAFFHTGQKVRSISHAISLLGYKNLRRWVILLLFAGEDENPTENPLFERAFIRGYMMEELSRKASLERTLRESAFITGSLSVIDGLLGMPMKEIVRSLSLSEPIEEALLFEMGELGLLLKIIKGHEASSLGKAEQLLSKLGLRKEDLFAAEMEAILDFHNMEKAL